MREQHVMASFLRPTGTLALTDGPATIPLEEVKMVSRAPDASSAFGDDSAFDLPGMPSLQQTPSLSKLCPEPSVNRMPQLSRNDSLVSANGSEELTLRRQHSAITDTIAQNARDREMKRDNGDISIQYLRNPATSSNI